MGLGNSLEEKTMPGKLGLKFKELMSGGFALGAADPATGEKQGNDRGTQLAMHCEVTIDDLERFTQDPRHQGSLVGSIDFAPWGTGMACDSGVFNLFSPGGSPSEKWMVYELGFEANNKRYYLAGKKVVRHDHGAEVLQETTTLYTVLHEGTGTTGGIVGAGVLHLGAKNIADLVKTIQVTNAQNPFETVRGLAMYLKLFLGELWHTYV
jgi:cholesterol oxidase